MPIQKSAAKTRSLPISGSKKLRRCRFRKSTSKTTSLPIQEIGSKNCVDVDSEIGSENYITADFWQHKTASLPIQEISSEN
jgi:hypothetical protein